MRLYIGILFLTIILGCKSLNNLNDDEFIFTMESLNYPFRIAVYDSESNKYSYKINDEQIQIVNIPFTNAEKDSLRKILPKNFCQCIKSYDEKSNITYKRIHRLVYKQQKEQQKCDTILANPNLPEMNQFKFFAKFRTILTKKPEYKFTFPDEFVTL